MRIEVRLFATLAGYCPAGGRGGRAFVELPEGSTVADVAQALGIPADLPRVVLVNGEDGAPGRRLAPHDVVDLFPPLAGGAREA